MKKLMITVLFTMFVLVGTSASATPKSDAPYTVITAQILQEMQKNEPDLVIIDARGGKYFDGVMIQGAVNLPTYDVTAEKLAEIAPDKAQKIVFYCVNVDCPAGELAAYKANAAGYTDIYDYAAGIQDWVKLGLPTNKKE